MGVITWWLLCGLHVVYMYYLISNWSYLLSAWCVLSLTRVNSTELQRYGLHHRHVCISRTTLQMPFAARHIVGCFCEMQYIYSSAQYSAHKLTRRVFGARFQGISQIRTSCSSCAYTSIREDTFNDICLSFKVLNQSVLSILSKNMTVNLFSDWYQKLLMAWCNINGRKCWEQTK